LAISFITEKYIKVTADIYVGYFAMKLYDD